jgi:hypothetical protein
MDRTLYGLVRCLLQNFKTRGLRGILPILVDTEYPPRENRGMPTTKYFRTGWTWAICSRWPSCSDDRPRPSRAVRLSHLMLLAIGAYFCCNLALWAQTSDSQTGDENKSWMATTESQGDNLNPTRIIERHTRSGNRTLDEQSVQVRWSDGHFEPYQDIVTETVHLDATTVRTTTRAFARDADGVKILVQVIEEEKHTLPGGESDVIRAISDTDINGKVQLVQRQIEETKKISEDVEETKTTVMLPSVSGGLAPAMKLQERRQQGANSVESQKTTLLPDGAGNWQVSEMRQASTRQEDKNRSTEERVSRPDFEGKLGEVSRTVSKESESTPGERRYTVETYSVDVSGWARDGSLHLVERVSTAQRTSPTGQQTTEQQVEQPNPGDPRSGLRVTTLTTDVVRPGPSGAQATRTFQVRDPSGSLRVVSVDTTKSDNIQAIQIRIAPPEKSR